MLILECSKGCYRVKIRPGNFDLWPWKSIGFQTFLTTKYVPSLVKIHWRMLILVLTRMLCGKNLTRWPWPLTLKINRVPDSLRTKYVLSLVKIHWRMLILVFTRMLRGKNLTRWHWPLTYDLLTKLGTYLVVRRVWNPIDFQGHRSNVKVTGYIFYRVTSLWTL
jgi:hypothetical protein